MSPLTQVNLGEAGRVVRASRWVEKPEAAPRGEAASAERFRHQENPMAPATMWTL
jgi:hypothetical protein